MRCPKCEYLDLESSDRCRNCGYSFALAAEPSTISDLPIRSQPEPFGPLTDLDLEPRTPSSLQPWNFDVDQLDDVPPLGELPLFGDQATPDARDSALARRSIVRPPLSVRRATPRSQRGRAQPSRAPREAPVLDLAPFAAAVSEPPVQERDREMASADIFPRLAAAFVDAALITLIDGVTLYLALKLCGLPLRQAHVLPLMPLAGFFAVLNGGYFVGFTAAGGQTLGKMIAGIKVVARDGGRLNLGHVILRTAAYAVSALPAGLGFAAALLGRDHLALHDRLAASRVVKAAAH